MKCEGCGNDNAWHVRTRFTESGREEICNACGLEGAGDGIPDVYWPGHPHYNPNICDKMGRPIHLTSRGHKAEVMKEIGLQEAGDRRHGARTIF